MENKIAIFPDTAQHKTFLAAYNRAVQNGIVDKALQDGIIKRRTLPSFLMLLLHTMTSDEKFLDDCFAKLTSVANEDQGATS